MSSIQTILDTERQRRENDKKRWDALDDDLCMICHAYGADKRSLFVSCFYAVHEVVPEAIDLFLCDEQLKDRGYYLRICKSCRGSFLGHMEKWANERRLLRGTPLDHDGSEVYDTDGMIPVRINGCVRFLTREEWDERQATAEHDAPEKCLVIERKPNAEKEESEGNKNG